MEEENAVDATEINDSPVVGEFLIVLEGKRTIKTSCSGQTIEALKRAKTPLTLKVLASRVKLTKAGKALKVKDVKARVGKCARWYRDNTSYVIETEDGFELARATV